jgi:hypothetical protein
MGFTEAVNHIAASQSVRPGSAVCCQEQSLGSLKHEGACCRACCPRWGVTASALFQRRRWGSRATAEQKQRQHCLPSKGDHKERMAATASNRQRGMEAPELFLQLLLLCAAAALGREDCYAAIASPQELSGSGVQTLLVSAHLLSHSSQLQHHAVEPAAAALVIQPASTPLWHHHPPGPPSSQVAARGLRLLLHHSSWQRPHST